MDLLKIRVLLLTTADNSAPYLRLGRIKKGVYHFGEAIILSYTVEASDV